MTPIITFVDTKEELLSGIKIVTRRGWSEKYHAQICDRFKKGLKIMQAYDRSPRNKGVKIGEIELTHKPYRQRLGDMVRGDLIAEGNLWAATGDLNALVNDFITRFPSKVATRKKFVSVVKFRLLTTQEK